MLEKTAATAFAEELYTLKEKKDEIEKRIKELDAMFKQDLADIGSTAEKYGEYLVTLTHHKESKMVDTQKLKDAGLFDQYSKTKAGFDALSIKKA